MSELDIAERRVPQDGRFRVRYKSRLIDFRVSIMPTVHGENAVLRVLDKESMSEKFNNLTLDVVGFAEEDLRRFRRYIREPYGMVLVTGPTGSGKTTTLYAALNEIKSDEDKIITIEDPVEYQIRGITQIPVNEKKGLTFARGLRSILRHDPDKILVGEIRDQETAQIAINSALTGHLVFTTVHANNVVDVLGRFLNMGVEAYNFVSALNCILAQRLVRTICEYCARTVTYTTTELLSQRHGPRRVARLRFPRGPGLHGVRRHRLSRPYRHSRAARPDRPDPRDDSRKEAHLGSAQAGAERRHELPARVGPRPRPPRPDHAQGDQQGYVHRGVTIVNSILSKAQLGSQLGGRPPVAVELSPEGVLAAASPGQGQPPVYAFEPLPAGALVPGIGEPNLRAPEAVADAIRTALDQVSPRTRSVTLILPDTVVRVFVLDFDSLPAKADEAIPVLRFRLRKMVPFDVEHAGLSYQVWSRTRPNARCWPPSCPARFLPEYEAAVRAAGYEPGAVLPSSLAALEAIDSLEAVLAANLSAQALTTSITNGQDLLLYRTLDLPEDSAQRLEEVQRGIAVAAAYFEDKLGARPRLLHYAGIGAGGNSAAEDFAAGSTIPS